MRGKEASRNEPGAAQTNICAGNCNERGEK